MLKTTPPLDARGTYAIDVLSSADFETVPYAGRQDALAKKLGLDLGAIVFALDHIPLALNGPAHRQRRAEVSKLIRAQMPGLTEKLPDIARSGTAPLAKAGPVNVLDAMVLPIVGNVLAVLTGSRLADQMSLVSRTFSQTLGPGQRKRLQAELAAIKADFEDQFPDATSDEIGARVALVILGRDALIGTLARSMKHHFDLADGNRLTDVEAPKAPLRTGVPYIDRVAKTDTDLGGDPVPEGTVVRCHLQSLEEMEEVPYQRFFGAGPHVCLGRPMSLSLYDLVSTELSKLPVFVSNVDLAFRKDDVFLYPSRFTAEVTL